MVMTHMPDGTKQITDANGVVTSHMDASAALHYESTGERLSYDGGTNAPQVNQGGKDCIDLYKERCRNQGRARANKSLGIK